VPSLIDELKSEHRVLLSHLQEARAVNLDPEALKRLLVRTKSIFLAHLTKEDLRFYPPLEKAARTDSRLQAILLLFREGMAAVGLELTAFYEKLDADGFGDDFPVAFGAISARLRSRISHEESILYPEYTRLALG
jgi:hypothetical protein